MSSFYAFEGIDGAGKSTQIALLAEHLERATGRRPEITYEPGGTTLGDSVRALVLDIELGDLDPATELFLFMAARSELVRKRIRPWLDAGGTVLCDRFLWSSVVYQGVVGGIGVDRVLDVGQLACDGILPDRTFLLDLPVEHMMRRKELGAGGDRIEEKGASFQERVRQGFLSLAERFADRFVIIDATGSPDRVHRDIVESL